METQWMPGRALTSGEMFDATMLAIGLVPFPPCQVISDLDDYATILRYLYDGKDTIGRDITRLDFAASCAGVLLPDVLEVVAKKAIRLIATWDGPGKRITDTFLAVKPSDLSGTVVPFLERSSR